MKEVPGVSMAIVSAGMAPRMLETGNVPGVPWTFLDLVLDPALALALVSGRMDQVSCPHQKHSQVAPHLWFDLYCSFR